MEVFIDALEMRLVPLASHVQLSGPLPLRFRERKEQLRQLLESVFGRRWGHEGLQRRKSEIIHLQMLDSLARKYGTHAGQELDRSECSQHITGIVRPSQNGHQILD